ncbi:MAG: hypothetical protein AAF797_09195 [Planctomycetota bacterium]
MSRKIRITYEARNKRDGKEMLRWLQSDATRLIKDLDAEIKIDNREQSTSDLRPVPDEEFETDVAAAANEELDRLAELAAAVEDRQSDTGATESESATGRLLLRRRREQKEAQERLRSGIASAAKLGIRLLISLTGIKAPKD